MMKMMKKMMMVIFFFSLSLFLDSKTKGSDLGLFFEYVFIPLEGTKSYLSWLYSACN